MNTYRVTLRAFGTSGVLLAASVAMLATVSALVAFNGWPGVNRSGGVDSVSVTGSAAPSALLVRAAPRAAAAAQSKARGAAPAGFVKVAAPAGTATGGFAAGFVKTVGPGGGFSLGPLQFAPTPSPSVPGRPYGEGGGPGTQLGTPTADPGLIPSPARNAACDAGGSVCGVTQVGDSLGSAPAVTTPPAPLPQASPVEVPVQAPVEAPAQVTGPLPGG